jgi:glycosyltransferase involved in cell wall biosynthesis
VRIAIFDYKIIATNPVGSCHLKLLRGLAHEHTFTVFAVEFENPCPDRIEWVRIRVPTRPLALLFPAYHVLARMAFVGYTRHNRNRFDVVQMVESNLSFGDVSYSHFCHRRYLRQHWSESPVRGVRGLLRRLDHKLHSIMEPLTYAKVKRIVVPSRGLAEELASEYPSAGGKLRIIYNPVDLERFQKPADFDRDAFRRSLGIRAGEFIVAFAALGHFERKGLPLVLDALTHVRHPSLKLLVVGGEPELVSAYRSRAESMQLQDTVRFTGMQRDVAPYFWSADAFLLASSYETFSLVVFQAAAASLPVIATRVSGVSELIEHGRNGLLVERTRDGIAAGLEQFLDMSPEGRRQMGESARQSVLGFGEERFLHEWREFYRRWSEGTEVSR